MHSQLESAALYFLRLYRTNLQRQKRNAHSNVFSHRCFMRFMEAFSEEAFCCLSFPTSAENDLGDVMSPEAVRKIWGKSSSRSKSGKQRRCRRWHSVAVEMWEMTTQTAASARKAQQAKKVSARSPLIGKRRRRQT